MDLPQPIHKKIDATAQKQLAHLQAKTLPFEIMGCIEDFRNELANQQIISDEVGAEGLTHSKKIPMELTSYFQSKDIIKFSCAYFGTEHCYVTNHQSGSGIVFIGHVNNIYASNQVLDCLINIATEIRGTYLKKLTRYKKQSTKEERADEYMSEWFHDLTEEARYYTWYDACSHDDFKAYVKKNFRTSEEERELMLRAIEIIKPIYETEPDPTMTWGEFKKEVFKTFPEKLVRETAKEMDEMRSQDVVVLFPSGRWMDEDDCDEEEDW